MKGAEVLMVEVRTVWNDPTRWMDHAFAKLKFIQSSGEWQLFWQRASLKWQSYEPKPAARDLAALVAEVDRDPHGCFFGGGIGFPIAASRQDSGGHLHSIL